MCKLLKAQSHQPSTMSAFVRFCLLLKSHAALRKLAERGCLRVRVSNYQRVCVSGVFACVSAYVCPTISVCVCVFPVCLIGCLRTCVQLSACVRVFACVSAYVCPTISVCGCVSCVFACVSAYVCSTINVCVFPVCLLVYLRTCVQLSTCVCFLCVCLCVCVTEHILSRGLVVRNGRIAL